MVRINSKLAKTTWWLYSLKDAKHFFFTRDGKLEFELAGLQGKVPKDEKFVSPTPIDVQAALDSLTQSLEKVKKEEKGLYKRHVLQKSCSLSKVG